MCVVSPETANGLAHRHCERLISAVSADYLGPRQVVEFAVAALLARGHLLLEDVPGVGKTTLARSLAGALGLKVARVQCTPDLLPSDVIGYSLPLSGDLTFRPGPIFSNVVLVDEINRAAPRTQSAFLEAMEEHQVTAEGETRPLPRPFFVIATQNPIEIAGTYPLPESQLDRFHLRLRLGYPARGAELTLLQRADPRNGSGDPRNGSGAPLKSAGTGAGAVLGMDDLDQLWAAVGEVACSDNLLQYLIEVGAASRQHASLRIGISPRGLLNWKDLGRAVAFVRGRDFVLPDDLLDLAPAALAHRLLPNVEHRGLVALDPQEILEEILKTVPLPL